MHELQPVLTGVVVALIAARLAPGWPRRCVLLALSVAGGIAASLVSGELALAWWYAAIDTAQVLVAAAVVLWLGRSWRRSIESRHGC